MMVSLLASTWKGGLPAPVGIEAPGVEQVGGVVAPEEFVDTSDGFSGDDRPLAAV